MCTKGGGGGGGIVCNITNKMESCSLSSNFFFPSFSLFFQSTYSLEYFVSFNFCFVFLWNTFVCVCVLCAVWEDFPFFPPISICFGIQWSNFSGAHSVWDVNMLTFKMDLNSHQLTFIVVLFTMSIARCSIWNLVIKLCYLI